MAIGWLQWGDEAFARCRAETKPLLLSLTARWCHACHRMEEETWDDPGVAAAVERATVPVQVDADARPDVYGCYHLGGLPTTALLTPDGDFIRGGTFLSPPQFFAFLEAALGDFRAGRRPGRRALPPPRKPASLVDEVVARLVRRADLEHGGFGQAPKLPEVEALTLLLDRWRSTRDGALERVVRATLDAVVRHLADPRDGGFFRYAAGADWSGPHTEKVAVDQARLTRLCLESGSALGESSYVLAARHALAHARRRLVDEAGRVFSSVAADPEYYAGSDPGDDPPAVDHRRFASSNAAMLGAAWLGFAVTGEPPGVQAEFRAAAPAGCVPHRFDEVDEVAGLLGDQALALEATLLEYRLSGAPPLLEWAERAADWSIRHLWDEGAGAFRAAPAGEDRAVTLPPIFPLLGNGEIALGLIGLAAQTGREAYRRHAERLIEALGPQALVSPAGPAVALAARRLEDTPAEAELRGDPGDARARDLARVVIAALGPSAVVRWSGGVEPGVVLCVRDLCLPSLGDSRELVQSLMGLELVRGGILSFHALDERES